MYNQCFSENYKEIGRLHSEIKRSEWMASKHFLKKVLLKLILFTTIRATIVAFWPQRVN